MNRRRWDTRTATRITLTGSAGPRLPDELPHAANERRPHEIRLEFNRGLRPVHP